MSSGANHPPVEKTRESYTARFVYEEQRQSGSESYDTFAGFNAGILEVLTNASNISAHSRSISPCPTP